MKTIRFLAVFSVVGFICGALLIGTMRLAQWVNNGPAPVTIMQRHAASTTSSTSTTVVKPPPQRAVAPIHPQSFAVQEVLHDTVLLDLEAVAGLDVQLADPTYALSAHSIQAHKALLAKRACDAIARFTAAGGGADASFRDFQLGNCQVKLSPAE